jgi:carbon monoxide dehydrogenase subunit G
MKVTSSVEIARPADEVFDFLAEVENNTRWLSGMRSSRWTSDPPRGVGSTYEQEASFLGKRIVTSFEVTELEPGRSVTITSRASSFPLRVRRSVEALGAGRSRVDEVVEADPSGFYRRWSALLRQMVQRRIRRDYRRLKQLLETAAPQE